jgi:fucose 4-O-acetylase-like acetyltransferase
MENIQSREKYNWILIAKGIGIILVVVGHFCPDSSPRYWTELKDIIYTFHMPLFFILSGFLYEHGKYAYSDLIHRKIKRLLFPFASIACLFLIIKLVASRYIYLEHPISLQSITALFTAAPNSYMPLLWFIHSLFFIFIIYPLLRRYLNNSLVLVFLITINTIFGSGYLILGKAIANMPFFVIGVIFRENRKIRRMLFRSNIYCSTTFLILLLTIYPIRYLSVVDYINRHPDFIYNYPAVVFFGLVGSLFIINLSRSICELSKGNIKKLLLQIGYYSMTIYLLHTLFENAMRIGLIYSAIYNLIPFEIIAFLIVFSGIYFPLLIEKKFFRNYSITRKYLLGI